MIRTRPLGSHPAASATDAAIGISTDWVAMLDRKVVMITVAKENTNITVTELGFSPRMDKIAFPIISPAPVEPRASATIRTPASIQVISAVRPFTASGTETTLV